MIILNEAVKPKTTVANSTYPAIIVHVPSYDANTSLSVNLTFYCPGTMSGKPADANYSATNNVVSAPTRASDDKSTIYNYQRGGIIIISYSDGNTNSPQFVRYVPVDDSVIKWNANILDGANVLTEDVVNYYDTKLRLDDEVLRRGRSLLYLVKICAKGKEGAKDVNLWTFTNGVAGADSQYREYRQCGEYGTELISKETISKGLVSSLLSGKKELSGLYEGSYTRISNITFLDFCNRSINYAAETGIDPVEIITIEKDAVKESFGDTISSLASSSRIYDNFRALAGYGDWESVSKLSPNKSDELKEPEYSSMEKKALNILSGSQTLSYSYNEKERKFINVFWSEFYTKWKNEFDRYYAIILTNNLARLVDVEKNNLLYLILVVIVTAYSVIEYVLLSGKINTKNISEQIFTSSTGNITEEIKAFFDSYYTWIYDKTKYNNTNFIEENKDGIVRCFTALILNEVCKFVIYNDYKNFEKAVSDNIRTMINVVIKDSNKLLSIFSTSTDNSSSSTDNTTSSPTPSPSPSGFIWPVPGSKRISQPFKGKAHGGIDISGLGKSGVLDVIASAAGKVIEVHHWNSSEGKKGKASWGTFVLIDHGNNIKTRYAHLDSTGVFQGQTVTAGTYLGKVGNTGNSTGPHLHFEVYKNGTRVNPLDYVSPTA